MPALTSLVLLAQFPVTLARPSASHRRLNRHIDWTRNGANHDPYYQLPDVFYANATASTPRQLVAYSASLGADAIQVDAMNEFGYASWLSKVPGQPVYPVLAKRKFDWLGEMRDALRARGMGLYIYLPLAYNQHWADTHNGSTYPNWVTSVCFNDRGYLELYLNLTHELLRRYQPDGFRFDGFSQQHLPWVCRTAGDQDFYRSMYGEEMPAVFDESNWRRGYDFGRASMSRFLTAIRRAALAEDPTVMTWANTFTPNSAASDVYIDWSLGHNVTDVGFVEDATDSTSADYAFLVQLGRGFQAFRGFVSGQWCGFDVRNKEVRDSRRSPAGPAISTSSHLAVAMGGNMYNYIEYYNKSAGLPTEPHACCGHPGVPGQSIDIFASDARALYGTFMADNDAYIQGAVPIDYVALVISEETRYRWHHYDRSQYKAVMKAVFAHYFDKSTTLSFIMNLDLPTANLSKYKLLVIIETSGFANAETAALEEYVRDGGRLLLAGGAGLFDATGQALSDYTLTDVQGLRWRARHCTPSNTAAGPVAHPNSFCCVLPFCGGAGNFTLVENVSLARCSKDCAERSCPCFDYSPVPPHPGQSQCRVVAQGFPFQLDSTHPYTTAYTTAAVPAPSPTPGPSPSQTPMVCVEEATPTTAAAIKVNGTTGTRHPLVYTNNAGKGTVVTVMLDAAAPSGAGPSPHQLVPLLLKQIDELAGSPPLEITRYGGSNGTRADIVLRVQHDTRGEPQHWVLHFLTEQPMDVALNVQYIKATRVVWQYPDSAWNCSLVGSTLHVRPGVGVRGRLVVLK